MIIERRLVEIDLEKKKEKGLGREKTIVFDPRPRNERRKWDSRGEGGGKLRKLARETLERVGRPIVQFRHSLPVLVTRSYIPVVIISTDRRCDLCLPPEGRKKCCATRRRQGFVAFPGKRFPCKRGTCERPTGRSVIAHYLSAKLCGAELPPSPPIAATSTNCSL